VKGVRCSPETALDEHASAEATTFVEHVAPLERECGSLSRSLAGQDADEGCARRIEAGPDRLYGLGRAGVDRLVSGVP